MTNDPQKAKIEILLSCTIVGPILEGYSANPDRNSESAATYALSMDETPQHPKTIMCVGVVHTLALYPTYGYVKTVVLEAWDTGRGGKNTQGMQFWKLMTSCSGTGNDLREEFPFMMAAAINYLGRDTQKVISVTVKENNPLLLCVKGFNQ